jgi:bacterioferritin
VAQVKRNKDVISLLNEVLSSELTAINQYFLHAEMCENWGLDKLHQSVREQSIGEMKHAEQLIERILFLEGIPNVQRMGKITIGESVPEQFKLDMALEVEAVDRLNQGIDACRTAGDSGSQQLLESILESEEEHLDWLEAQLHLIDKMGEANYLTTQV